MALLSVVPGALGGEQVPSTCAEGVKERPGRSQNSVTEWCPARPSFYCGRRTGGQERGETSRDLRTRSPGRLVQSRTGGDTQQRCGVGKASPRTEAWVSPGGNLCPLKVRTRLCLEAWRYRGTSHFKITFPAVTAPSRHLQQDEVMQKGGRWRSCSCSCDSSHHRFCIEKFYTFFSVKPSMALRHEKENFKF